MNENPSASQSMPGLTLLPERLGVFRFDPSSPVPDLAGSTQLWSITRTRRELSVVAEEGSCSWADAEDPGWRCLYVAGPIPFDLPGIVAGISTTIAAQGLPVFVLSTFDSDLILLRSESLDQSLQALRHSGYAIHLPEAESAAP